MADHQSASVVPARRQLSPQNPANRAKRRKYTAVACDECRRRKLKCVPGGLVGSCQRCASKGYAACNYKALRHESTDAAQRGRRDDHETISSLRRDVEMLRNTLSDLMAMAGGQGGPHGCAQRQHAPQEALPPTPATLPAPQPDTTAPGSETPGPATPTPMPAVTVAAVNGISAPSPSSGTAERAGSSDGEFTKQTSPPAPNWEAPEEPRFIGPTRSAYSLEAGDRALSRLGVPKFDNSLQGGQRTPSGAGTPRRGRASSSDGSFWESCDAAEFARLIRVFQEEVESVYPCLQIDRLVQNSAEILQVARMPEYAAQDAATDRDGRVGIKDLHLAKLAIATAIVIEGHGQSEDSAMLVAPVECSVLSILKPKRELRDLQLLILLSIYYFHCGQDLLAWRSIGLAAREALVMGLHRKVTLLETFPEQGERELAVRIFWSIYILDRRWSFGTSLSFVLVDRDIDMELPEPGSDCAYLQCMVGYGRLCTVLWDALMPYGRRPNDNPDETMRDLDIKAQEWLESIPPELRLRHPRLGLAARAQPPGLQRLRALLYLRGNHSRILIYRYYLLGREHIRSSHRNAWLAVEIAQDSIQVLVHLNDSSDIYRRQQAAFNYFLLSALAVLFLAVCNDPETFAAPCKRSLHSAIDLLRYLSRHNWGSRRLWRSVRGIVPRLRYLENRRNEERPGHEKAATAAASSSSSSSSGAAGGTGVVGQGGGGGSSPRPNEDGSGRTGAVAAGPATTAPMRCGPPACSAAADPSAAWASLCDAPGGLPHRQPASSSTTMPDFGNVGDELMDLFERVEQGQPFAPPLQPEQQMDMGKQWGSGFYNMPNFTSQDQGVISWQFDWLIQ